MPLLYNDTHHCYNKVVVSVGTHLRLYYIHDSYFASLFLFLLTAGGILCQHMSVSNFVLFSGNHTYWN